MHEEEMTGLDIKLAARGAGVRNVLALALVLSSVPGDTGAHHSR